MKTVTIYIDRSHFDVFTRVVPLFSIVQPAKREEDWGPRSSRMRSDTLCLMTNFSLHCVTVETLDVALRICIKSLRILRRPRPLMVIAGANSPKSVTATLHGLPFRGWEQSIPNWWVERQKLSPKSGTSSASGLSYNETGGLSATLA